MPTTSSTSTTVSVNPPGSTGEPVTTPIPTLNVKEREGFLQDLMNSNGGCKLPCWWGIQPGKTTWREVQQFLLYIGAVTGISSSTGAPESVFHWANMEYEGQPLYSSLGFYERDERIEAISVVGSLYDYPAGFDSLWDGYSPELILTSYGVPSRVLLRAPGVTGIGDRRKVGYMMWIFYDHLGFMIRYDGEADDLPVFHICPSAKKNEGQVFRIGLAMQSVDDPRRLGWSDGILSDETEKDGVKTIHEAAGMSVQEFYSLFTQKNEPACFESPHDIWPKK